MVIYFLILPELMRFSVEFCVVKFSSFGQGFDGLWNKEWQEPKLGDAPEGEASPLSFSTLSVTSLGAMFSFIT